MKNTTFPEGFKLDFNEAGPQFRIEDELPAVIEKLAWIEGYLINRCEDEPGTFDDIVGKSIRQTIDALKWLDGARPAPGRNVVTLRRRRR
jgi:hypothetical protein